MSKIEVKVAILGGLVQSRKDNTRFVNPLIMSSLEYAVKANGGIIVNPDIASEEKTREFRQQFNVQREIRESLKLASLSDCAVVELTKRYPRAVYETEYYLKVVKNPVLILTNRNIAKDLPPIKSGDAWFAAYGDYNDLYRAIQVFLNFVSCKNEQADIAAFLDAYFFLGNRINKRIIDTQDPRLREISVPHPVGLVKPVQVNPRDLLENTILETAVLQRNLLVKKAAAAIAPVYPRYQIQELDIPADQEATPKPDKPKKEDIPFTPHPRWLNKKLSFAEERIIDTLKGAGGDFVRSEELCMRVWGNKRHRGKVGPYIANIRKKLGDNPRNPGFIGSKQGGGYRWLKFSE